MACSQLASAALCVPLMLPIVKDTPQVHFTILYPSTITISKLSRDFQIEDDFSFELHNHWLGFSFHDGVGHKFRGINEYLRS